MEYSKLGKSDLLISRIGFGCMSLKGTQHENELLIDRAIELGINFFDTADLYDKGMNETSVGMALKEVRDKVIIATKVGNVWNADGNGWSWNPRKAHILAGAEESLQRLQTDHIDLYQLHGGTIDDPIDEVIEAFELLQQQGKIRYYGISSIRPNVIREYVQHSNLVSVMMQYSLLDRRAEESCLPLLQQNNIGVLARGSIAQGLLIDKPAKQYLNYNEIEVKKAAEAVAAVSTNVRTATHTSLQFVLQHPAIVSAVTGIRTQEQLTDVVKALDVSHLTEPEMQILQEAIAINKYDQHR